MTRRTDELISGVKGKLGELKGICVLLRNGYTVYVPVVDIGVDCLIDVGRGNYNEIQIKYREDRGFFKVKEFEPRKSLYIMCYLNTRHGETYWVIPSKEFSRMAAHSRGYFRLQIGNEGSPSYEALRNYRENLNQLLRGATREARQTISRVRKRVKERHLQQRELELSICQTMFIAGAPTPPKVLINMLPPVSDLAYGSFSTLESVRRWERATLRAIATLKRNGMIQNLTDNLIMLTDKGKRFAQAKV